MCEKDKAYELINKVSDEMEQLPYSFCKALAKLICTEIIECNIGAIAEEPVNKDELCIDLKYWNKVKSIIDEA